ncbi:MAG: hypothetical protein ACM3SR_09320 [Ignavibacteriales bacterium]
MTKEELLNRTLEDLGKRYLVGLYEYLFKYRPDLYKELLDLEDRIDQTYLDPNASIDQLKAALRGYWIFHMKATREFQQIGQSNLHLSQVRQELTEERMRA